MVAQPIPGLEGYEPDWSQAASAAVDLRTHAQRVAKQRGVPEDVLLGVLGHESGLDPKAYGNGGGVGQFIESTARSYGTTQAELRANPKKAVDLAAQLLKDNADQFGGDFDKAAAAYFIGPGNVSEASQRGGAGWLAVADQLARKYNQGTVSSYLSSVHGGAGASAGTGISPDAPSGAPAAVASVRAMLGDVPGQPRQSVSDMLSDAREQREQELEAMTNVAPIADVTGGSSFGDLAQAPEDVALRSAGTLRSQLPGSRDDYLTSNALPALGMGLAAGVGLPALAGDAMGLAGVAKLASDNIARPSVLEPPPPLPSIRPPSVGDAGLAMLGAPDQDTQPTEPDLGVDTGVQHGPFIEEQRAYNERKYQDETNALLDRYRSLAPDTLLQHDEMRRELIDRTGVDPDTGGAAPLGGGDVVQNAVENAQQYGPRLTDVSRYDRLQALRDQYAEQQAPPPVEAGREDIPLRSQGTLRAQLGQPLPDMGTVPVQPRPDEGMRQDIINLGGIDPATGAPVMRGTQHYGPEQPSETSPDVAEAQRGTRLGELQAARAGRTDYAPAVKAALTAAPMILSGPSGGVGFALQGEAERLGAPKALSYTVGAIPFAMPTLEGSLVRQGLGGAERATLNPSLAGRVTTQAIRNPNAGALLTRAALSAPAQGGAAVLGEKVDTALGLPQVPGIGGLATLAASAAAERGVDVGLERFRGRPRYAPQPYRPELEPLVREARSAVQDFSFADPFHPTAAERQELAMRLGDVEKAEAVRGEAPGENVGPKKDAAYWGARVFTDFTNPVGTGLRILKEGLTGARGPLGPQSGVRRAERQADEEQGNVLGRNAMDARYGARVRADILEVRGQKAVTLIEGNLKKNNTTWAEFADAQAVFEPGTPLWERRPEEPGLAVLQQQMGAAQRRLRGGGGPQAGIVPGGRPRFEGEQNPVQPEDIAFGEQLPRDVAPEVPRRAQEMQAIIDADANRLQAWDTDRVRRTFRSISDLYEQDLAAGKTGEQLSGFQSSLREMGGELYRRTNGAEGIAPQGEAARAGMRAVDEVADRPVAFDPGAYERDLAAMDMRALRQEVNNVRNRLGRSREGTPQRDEYEQKLNVFEDLMERRQSGNYRPGGTPGGAMGIISPGRRDAQGRMVGRPESAQSDQAWSARVSQVMQQAVKGAAHRFWYRESASQIMELAGGNKQDADIITRMLALGSNQQKVADQGRTILQALNDYKDGRDIMRASNMGQRNQQIAPYLKMSNEQFDNFIVDAIQKGESEKVTNFYLDMMDDIDPVRAARLREASGATVTIDQWMNRAFGYKSDSRTPGQYKVMAEAVQHIADQLGWQPKEAQAAIWVQTIIDDGKTNAASAATNYRDAVRAHRGVIRQELMPSPDHESYDALSQAAAGATDQALAAHALDIHRAKLDETGHNVFAKLTNLPVTPDGEPLVGGSATGKAGGLVDPPQADAVTDWAALEAAAVGAKRASWLRPFDIKSKGLHNTWDVDPGRPVSAAELEALRNELPDLEVLPGAKGGATVFRVPGPDDYTARRNIAKEKIDLEKDSPEVVARKQAQHAEADRLNAESSKALKDTVAPLNKADRARVADAVNGVFSDAQEVTIDSYAADGRVIEDAQDHSQNGSLRRPEVRQAFSEVTGRIGAARDDFIGRSAGAGGAPGAARGGGGAGGPAAGIVPATGQGPGWLAKAANEVSGAAGALLSLKSSVSPPFLRQGLARALTNPRAAVRELGQSLGVTFDNAQGRQLLDSILGDEWVQKTGGAPAAGQQSLGLANPHAGRTWQDAGGTVLDWESNDPNRRPEELVSSDTFFGKLADKATGHSARQAAVELNLHRTNWYKEVASRMEKAGITDPKAYQELVKTIEQFTQRGTIGQGRVPLFFSTRAMSGRIQQAWRGVAALTRGVATGETFKPGAQQEAAKAFVFMVGANTAMIIGAYQAAQLAGLDPEIEKDGKLPVLKIGKTRWDAWAGLNTPARAAIGIIADTAANPEGGAENLPQAAVQALGNRGQKFLRGGVAPLPALALDTWQGRDFTGQKFNLAEKAKSGELAKGLLTPFIVETLLDAVKEDGLTTAAAVAGPAFLSTGINSYTTPEDKANDIAKQTFNGRKYAQLSTPEKLQVVDQLPEEHQKRIHDAKRDEYKADLDKAGWVEPEPEPKDKKETLAESKARAERNKPVNEKNAQVIADNPELELQRWYFANKHGGALNNKDAVSQSLALGLPEREVKFAGHDRDLAASDDDKAFWAKYGGSLDTIENGVATDPANQNSFAQYKYKKDFKQLDDKQKDDVLSDIRSAAKKNPRVEALMIFSGREKPDANGAYTASSNAVVNELQALWKDYPKAAPLAKRETTSGKATTLVVKKS